MARYIASELSTAIKATNQDIIDGTANKYPDAATLGTAAAADLTTSPTDTTTGRVLKTRWGGNGIDSASTAEMPALTTVDDNNLLTGVIYRSQGSTGGNKPFPNFNLICYRLNVIFTKQIAFEYGTGKIAERNIQSGVYPNWEKIYTEADVAASAQNLLANGSYGLGIEGGVEVTDLSDTEVAGSEAAKLFRQSTGSVGRPSGSARGGGIQIGYNDNERSQFYADPQFGRTYIRHRYSAMPNLWEPWFMNYDQSSILGTVSQSGGVPTGAIIERGSNANGEYVKFADGTAELIKYPITISATANVQASTVWTFPVALISAGSKIFTGSVQNHANTLAYNVLQPIFTNDASPTTSMTLYFKADVTQEYRFGVRIKGRWY